ncbi:MAG: LPS-assembly protein LptD, partial [Hyphomicrobiaceae bacterium]
MRTTTPRGAAMVENDRNVPCSMARVLSRMQLGSLSRFVAAILLAASMWSELLPATSAHAQTASENVLDEAVEKVSQDEVQPLLLQADELINDTATNTITAQGNVEIYYNGYTLLADKVIYDQTAKQLTAEGNVRIKEPDGAVVNAEKITLTDDFRDGFVESLRIVTEDDARIAAASGVRRDGQTTVFERGVYTPCKPCKDNPEKAPTWRIKAARVIQNKELGDISYEDAQFEFFGVPVAYLPFFSHPDPRIKRRSGFLRPTPGYSEELGAYVEVPYFWAIAPNMDMTFSPRLMTEQGLLGQLEFRHRVASGVYQVELAGIYDENSEAGTVVRDEFRGSIKTVGRFQLGTWWHWGWDATVETDDTFRRFYKLDSTSVTERTSKLYLEGLNDRNYFAANLYRFEDLQSDSQRDTESDVHPVIDYNYIFGSPVLGGELSFDANIVSLSRERDGGDQNKGVIEAQWRRQLIDGLGQVFTPFFRARGDVYNASDDVSGAPLTPTNTNERQTRGLVTAGLQYSYPFVAHTERASHVIEPIGQIIAREGNIDRNDVPDEDAQSLIFDHTLLFEADKFSGYDRVETGTTANVGIRYTMETFSGGYIRAVFGQSFHLADENAFDAGSGLGTDSSDFVGGISFAPVSNLTVIAQARFDQEDFTVQRQDIGLNADYGPLSVSGGYAFERAVADNLLPQTEEEFVIDGALQIAEYWSILGGVRYDLENDFSVRNTVGIKYADDCFVLA